MPKGTFLNLQQEKQEKIINIAMNEFADKGYQNCSIQSISDKAGIAKGSIYQYFNSKKDLFFYILDLAVNAKAELLEEIVKENREMPFFELIEKLFICAIHFASKHTSLYKIYRNLKVSAPKNIKEEFEKKAQTMGKEYYNYFIRNASLKGEVRTDISLELSSFMIFTMLSNFGDFLIDKTDIDNDESIKKYVLDFLEILKNGIKSKEVL